MGLFAIFGGLAFLFALVFALIMIFENNFDFKILIVLLVGATAVFPGIYFEVQASKQFQFIEEEVKTFEIKAGNTTFKSEKPLLFKKTIKKYPFYSLFNDTKTTYEFLGYIKEGE